MPIYMAASLFVEGPCEKFCKIVKSEVVNVSTFCIFDINHSEVITKIKYLFGMGRSGLNYAPPFEWGIIASFFLL